MEYGGNYSDDFNEEEYSGEEKSRKKLSQTQKEIKGVKKRLHKQEKLTYQLSRALETKKGLTFDAESESFLGDEEKAPSKSSNDDFEEANLNEDTFSFLVATRPCGIPFVTALMVVAFKNAIFLMIFQDMHDDDDGFDIPAKIAFSVGVAQIMALVMATITQNDLISASLTIYHGYHESMHETFPEGGRKWQWILGILLSLADGSFGLVVTFLLIITSETAFDVFLNFAAVEFVSGLDEIVFGLAQAGLLGTANLDASELVGENAYVRPKKKLRTPWVQILFIALVFFALLGGWIGVHNRQNDGEYTKQTLYVQFDDSFVPELAASSGFYEINKGKTRFEPGFLFKADRGDGQIGYCEERSKWTFFVGGDDPCKNIRVESIKTDSFEVLDTSADDWFVRSPEALTSIPMEDFHLSAGCEDDGQCGLGLHGKCVDDKCKCDDGYNGVRCTFKIDEVCSSLTLNELYASAFPTFRSVATTYELFAGGERTCYGRPVYVNNQTEDVVFFSGLRWALGNAADLFGQNSTLNSTDAVLERLVADDFHSCEVANVDSLSTAVLFRSDDDTTASPVGLTWSTTAQRSGGICNAELTVSTGTGRTEFVCSACSNSSNPCLYEGVCVANGTCACNHRATGSLCQVVPASDGFCDSFFNSGPFSFDGGDCCRSTCKNTAENSCGVIGDENGVKLVDVGFGSCVDPNVDSTCQNSNASCFVTISNIQPTSPARVRPFVSANGRFIAVSEIRFASTRVFEIQGSEWVQLGSALKPPRAEYTGEAVSIVSQSYEVVGTREVTPNLYVGVISYPETGAFPGTVSIYRYSFDRVGRFENWGEIEYADYEGFVQDEAFVDDTGQQTGSLTIGFHEICDTCPENALSVLKGRFELGEPDELDASNLKRNHVYHLHYRDSRACRGTGYYDGFKWDGVNVDTIAPRDEICGSEGNSSFYFAYSNYSTAAALSGDGRIFAKIPVNSTSIDFWVSPFLELNQQLENSFSLQDRGVEGEILEIKLSHYGTTLTVVTNATVYLFDVNVARYIFDGLSYDYNVYQVDGLTLESAFSEFAFPEIDGAKLSPGGSSVVLYRFTDRTLSFLNTNSPVATIDYQIISYDHFQKTWKNHGAFQKQEPFEGYYAEDFPSVSVSDNGDIVASTSDSFTEVEVKSLENKCGDDEYQFRLSITGDEDMAFSSWSFAYLDYSPLFGMAVARNETIGKSWRCAWCYSGLAEEGKYDNRVLAQDFCVPKAAWPCSRFYLAMFADNKEVSKFGSGFAAYQVDGSATSLVAAENSVTIETGFSKTMSDASLTCPLVSQPTCGENERLFSLLIPMSNNPGGLSWTITEPDSVFFETISSPDYTEYPPGQFVLEQTCLSQTACYTLDITEWICVAVFDACFSFLEFRDCVNEGICADFEDYDLVLLSSQNYTAYWGDELAFTGEYSIYSETVTETFGECS